MFSITCRRIEKRLKPFLDRQTTTEETRRIERHLHECRRCAGRLEELREISEMLGALPGIEPPRDLADRIVAAAAGLRDRQRPRQPGSMPAEAPLPRVTRWAAATLFLVGLLAGRFIYASLFEPPAIPRTESIQVLDGLERFAVVPPGSLEEGYWGLVPLEEEKTG